MAKVHIRDVVKADLEARYPGDDYTFSDRVLKLMTELDAYKRMAVRRDEATSQHKTQRSVPEEGLAEDLAELCISDDESP
ncbi:hypothetical protein D0962_35745 [Leptolyngbyaceae cyanobacterium CCMR0082]|uniref:Uncharacterized protein n=1 Tax=Adonisia turfae CCMR0082 TaxID=2304604 RepID=A0A6M0SI69_9CYAN|nr:hypothetical protein [Adonisia turfae]NEZ68026.1 hypothetical protein [Adonisia turfae CCMR0082]